MKPEIYLGLELLKWDVITPNDLIYAVCANLELDEKMVKSKIRNRELVEARAIIAFILRKRHKKATLEDVGKILNKNHATVFHYIKLVEESKFNPPFKNKIIKVLGEKKFNYYLKKPIKLNCILAGHK